MIAHVDPNDPGKGFLVSIPRDTWVNIPSKGDMKLNAAFNDGAQQLVDTLQQNFDISIDHYLEVNFESFGDLVNADGTVPVYSELATRDVQTGLLLLYPNACYHLTAGLACVRAPVPRNTGRRRRRGVSRRLDRIQRQQTIRRLGSLAVQRTDDPQIAPTSLTRCCRTSSPPVVRPHRVQPTGPRSSGWATATGARSSPTLPTTEA
jgi:LCP family protein required for cell wall assembly